MRLALLALTAAALFAQQPNTVTANVSVTQSVAAGATIFRIQYLDANTASTIDSALTALGSAGVAASHLSEVTVEISQGFFITTYNFNLKVPSGEFAATRDKLVAIQRTLATSQTQALGWTSTQTPTEDEISAALEQALPGLLDEARRRAGLLARAMKANLGEPVSLATPAVTTAGSIATFTLAATFAVTPETAPAQ